MSDLPFKAEYAKSGRASCRGCKTPIPQGSLRIAAMLQSAFFDGKQPNWYHDKCFFLKQRPKTVADVAYFTTLRYEDQETIRKAIESQSTGVVIPEAKSKKKGSKRSANGGSSQASLKDFEIEYSKSSRATCRVCDIKITKGEVRISKKVFDTEIGQKFGGQAMWHHVGCFVKDRSSLLFFGSGDMLPGFDSLKKEDQKTVKDELPALKSEEVPIKKIKEEPLSKEEKKVISSEEKILKAQNVLYYKYRDLLEKNLSKKDMKLVLEFNDQQVPSGESRMLNGIADIMCFGALLPCDVCKNGQFYLNTNGYICRGNLTEWTKCSNVTKTPGRVPFKIPDSLEENAAFKKYKFKKQERKFIDEAPSTSQMVKTESALPRPINDKPVPPLKNLQFYIHGYGSKIKEKIKIKILKLGGSVPSKITETLAAVVSTHEEVAKLSNKILEAQEFDIQVLENTFFDLIKPDGTVSETLKLIDEHNISSWGSSAASRIPKDVLDGKSNKSKSIYSKSSSVPTRLVIKDGTAVDPDADVDDNVHVYIDKQNGDKFSVVLGLTDIISQKNSYYKLQLLKKDSSNRFWLFRSWGRIGTTIGGTKTEKCSNLYEAMSKFEDLYTDKTGYPWSTRNQIDLPKLPGKMYPIDIDYGEKQDKIINLDSSSSKLPKPVQQLVKMIFDIDMMNKTMLEFQLDTEKMPLGKLSRKQLMSGYNVLTSLLDILTDDKDSKLQQSLIIDATNRFYTLIPHDFGVENPPLLNNEEIIKNKTLMLDNLIEMEIAYKLLHTTSEDESSSPLDSHYIKLKSEIVPLDVDSPDFGTLSKYLKNTHADTHSSYELEILQAFKVAREGEDKRFKPFQKLPNRRLLWHGSRVTNYAGILSQGLRIAPPEAPVTGYMFGKGIYFADMVSKSANYCCTNVNQPIGIILLCEVALGNMMELTEAKNVQKLKSNYHSVKGVGKTEPNPEENIILDCGTIVPLGLPIKKKEKTSLLYNEYIVYDVAQVKVKYLFQIKFKYNY